ncbi:6-phosphogluconolactonase [Melopsittacus undulatus]|uniref:6-phosphogluconolactonase n=1 Tax=Melopsittacus undulatus TaxID=13146 RepID=A0A8V5GUV3_MELUD|nr:6-phosphogluconolactonase [Melopsittacus undulatus]XP_033927803.1 6-phosphogluconolactonase [Melopsittacus undulatus]
MAPGAACRVSVLREPGPGLARFVAAQAAAAGGRFTLGVSGGSLVELLALHLPSAVRACPSGPGPWLLALCDERLVPPEHPDSTAGAYQARLLPRMPSPGPTLLAPSPRLAPAAAAADYAARLRQAFPGEPVPVFDLLLLGVGPDGHTCSLFPGHPLLQEQEAVVAAITDSPKPPPERITFTLPVLNAAKAVVFVATGEGKAAVVKRILEGDEENPLPAARVRPRSGQLCWILDEAAAKELTIPVENSIP